MTQYQPIYLVELRTELQLKRGNVATNLLPPVAPPTPSRLHVLHEVTFDLQLKYMESSRVHPSSLSTFTTGNLPSSLEGMDWTMREQGLNRGGCWSSGVIDEREERMKEEWRGGGDGVNERRVMEGDGESSRNERAHVEWSGREGEAVALVEFMSLA